jgi:hypothetical protein
MASMWAHSLNELTRFQAREQERHPDALELIVGERRARSEVGAKHVKGAHRGPKALPCPARCQGRAGCLSGILGIFSDWPATVSYYASCMGLK